MILMYHSITGAGDIHPASGFHRNRYSVTDQALEVHARHCASSDVTFTFDDGHVSIFERAFPIVAKRVPTIVFVSTGFIGQSDWLTRIQIREMHNNGIEIAAHGHTHRGFSSLPHDLLLEELTRPKAILEEIIGATVPSLSLVGGHYNRHVLQVARELGYGKLYSSHPVRGRASHGLLGRVCIYHDTDLPTFEAICRGAVPLGMQLSYYVKAPVKQLRAWVQRVRFKAPPATVSTKFL